MYIRRRRDRYSLNRNRSISGYSYKLKGRGTLSRDRLIISTGNLLLYLQINIETMIIRYKDIYNLICAVYNQFPYYRQ